MAYDSQGRVFRVSDPFYDSSKTAQAASGVKVGVWDTGIVSARIPRFTETSYDA